MFDINYYLSKYTSDYRPLLRQYRFPLLAVLALPLLREAYQDYCGWYNLGAGGVPHNVLGWGLQCMLRLVASTDTRSTGCYGSVNDSDLDGQSFLDGTLPTREGTAPEVAPFVAPHRQLTDTASAEVKKTFRNAFQQIPAHNESLLESSPSLMEGGTSPAVFVSEPSFTTNHLHSKRSPREVFHIHTSEGSSHGIFSKADAKIIIEKGWGERHGLGGRAMGIPNTYLMIYAPRNENEVEIICKLAKAAARYGLEGKTIS
ncbi:hypothetical protein MMC30_006994 [Trapelia coarctata]|nr:hypothetical protein [Trapelia coarctata]